MANHSTPPPETATPAKNALDEGAVLRLDDQLCFGLYAATNAVVRAYRPLLAEIGLTYPQYLVMLVLWQDGNRPAGEIATRLHLGNNALTPLLDRLEAAGFVRRVRDPQDRRRLSIHLTENGRTLEHRAAAVQSIVECRTGLSGGALADLRDELHALVARMAAAGVSLGEVETPENGASA
ncbi:MAG: MarR family transcriptional regulator [Pseudomonadota bacterium]